MGYQVVDLVLKSGELLKDRIVLNATYLRLDEEEYIDKVSITEVHLAQTLQ